LRTCASKKSMDMECQYRYITYRGGRLASTVSVGKLNLQPAAEQLNNETLTWRFSGRNISYSHSQTRPRVICSVHQPPDSRCLSYNVKNKPRAAGRRMGDHQALHQSAV
jgi:hypothetical protein